MVFRSLMAAEKEVYVEDELLMVKVPLIKGLSVAVRVSFTAFESTPPLGEEVHALSVWEMPDENDLEPRVTGWVAFCAREPFQLTGDCGTPSKVQFTVADVRLDRPKFFMAT